MESILVCFFAFVALLLADQGDFLGSDFDKGRVLSASERASQISLGVTGLHPEDDLMIPSLFTFTPRLIHTSGSFSAAYCPGAKSVPRLW